MAKRLHERLSRSGQSADSSGILRIRRSDLSVTNWRSRLILEQAFHAHGQPSASRHPSRLLIFVFLLQGAAVSAAAEPQPERFPGSDGWKPLFNGKNLDGWKPRNPRAKNRVGCLR